MNPRIRWVGIVLVLLFVLLFLQLNNIQIRESGSLKKNALAQPIETGHELETQPRGAILSADHKVLAYSRLVHGKEQRIYPAATAFDFAQLTGSLDPTADAIEYGIEEEYNSYLSEHESSVHSLKSLLTQHEETDDVILTVPTTLQEDAAELVGNDPGAQIVALDPRDGDILAMYGARSYNPNTLSSLDAAAATKAFAALAKQNPEPFLSLASAETHAPGSTFKIVDTTAIFDHDPSLVSSYWTYETEISLPDTNEKFHNYDYEDCGGSLANILAASCDTAFAEVGLALGAKTVVHEAEDFGWCEGLSGDCKAGGSRPPLDLPAADVSGATIASEEKLAAAPPYLAYSAIGQFDDQASALSMALVAAGIADKGKIMTPHLMREIIDSDGNVVKRYAPRVWKRATSASTAAKVRNLMLGVTEDPDGTAYGVFTNLESKGIQVAAKTGTAEVTEGQCATNDWLVGMAPAGKGQTPKAVVAVEVPTPSDTVGCDERTGATVAGPLIDQMLTDVLDAGY